MRSRKNKIFTAFAVPALSLALCACSVITEPEVTRLEFAAPESAASVPAGEASGEERTYDIAEDTTGATYIDSEIDFAILGLYETQVKIRDDEIEAERKALEEKKKKEEAERKKKEAAKKKKSQQKSGNGSQGSSQSGGSQGGGQDYSSGSDRSTYTYSPPDISGYTDQVVGLVNEQRAANGLGALTVTSELNAAAQKRAEEIVSLFSHSRPDGSSCFTVLGEFGISYFGAGENIAAGQSSPSSVMNAWMNSEGHRANILKSSFGHIGVGCVYVDGGYGYYWVQLFTD